jgi:hypothetical protein
MDQKTEGKDSFQPDRRDSGIGDGDRASKSKTKVPH